jgi:hypothetical protein
MRMVERRLEPRLLCADLIRIEWTDGRGRRHDAAAVLEDIARSGASLQTDIRVPVAADIKLHRGTKTLSGKVRYCAFREIGYFIGVNFDRHQKWSIRFFRPKHLTDPGVLQIPGATR